MEPRDLYSSLTLCNLYLNEQERAGIEDAALLMHVGTRAEVRLAEQARERAGYGREHRHQDHERRGLL